MAVRLLNMPGDKLINDDNATTFVDFVTQSSEQFNSKTPLEFVTFVTQAGNPDPKISGAYFADPSHGPLLARLVAANKHTDNVLNIPYFSTTPYRFGKSEKVAVKYKIQPTSTNHPNKSVTDPNYLKENLVYDLSQGDVSFDFMIQFQTNADTQPIEDPTIIWGSPFIKIATIIIPKQVFDTPEKNSQAENMAFNPWHTIEAHQPLGGINRARKIVYEAMQKIRHQQNGVK